MSPAPPFSIVFVTRLPHGRKSRPLHAREASATRRLTSASVRSTSFAEAAHARQACWARCGGFDGMSRGFSARGMGGTIYQRLAARHAAAINIIARGTGGCRVAPAHLVRRHARPLSVGERLRVASAGKSSRGTLALLAANSWERAGREGPAEGSEAAAVGLAGLTSGRCARNVARDGKSSNEPGSTAQRSSPLPPGCLGGCGERPPAHPRPQRTRGVCWGRGPSSA